MPALRYARSRVVPRPSVHRAISGLGSCRNITVLDETSYLRSGEQSSLVDQQGLVYGKDLAALSRLEHSGS